MVTRGRVKPWSDFERSASELAAIGRDRLSTDSPNYLATIRGGGLPRVHPVSATVRGGRLAVYMYPTSPKGQDLVVDGRYAPHCSVLITMVEVVSSTFAAWARELTVPRRSAN
jgi:hypothetical protein